MPVKKSRALCREHACLRTADGAGTRPRAAGFDSSTGSRESGIDVLLLTVRSLAGLANTPPEDGGAAAARSIEFIGLPLGSDAFPPTVASSGEWSR
jgi:hypothetical protein